MIGKLKETGPVKLGAMQVDSETGFAAVVATSLDGKPIGYVQSYDPHLEDDHPYQDQPFGTLGIDVTIGVPELVGIGHGSRLVNAFVEILFEEGCPRVIIDPHPGNGRAIRAYEKAGFRRLGERTTPFGPALIMAIDAEAED